MLDSLAIALALIATPVARPNLERVATVKVPTQSAPIVLARATEIEPEKVTTCYLANASTCWTEN